MEKYQSIINNIRELQSMQPPDNLVSHVMAGTQKIENSFPYKFNRFLFQPRELSSDAAGLLSGQIMSSRQCSFLLFMVGLLYFIVGVIVIVGLKNALSDENINLWLRIQPYITIVSAILIICLGFIILYKPQMIIFAKYGIIVHTAFIAVNACVLEFSLFSPQALVFTLILTTAAMILGVLLISSIRKFLKFGLSTTRSDCAQNT